MTEIKRTYRLTGSYLTVTTMHSMSL